VSTKYVERIDLKESTMDVLSWLDEGNVAVLGIPGVGKSTFANAIAADHIQQKKLAIMLYIDSSKKPHKRNEPSENRISSP
jgi:putative protein kinase ArgK-like GTPase of G3E family